MNGLSLEQAPPYKIPLLYYMVGSSYLLLFSVVMAFYGSTISDRYFHEAIAITHLFTLGFVMNIIFGTLFQMMPVIIGEAYKDVALRAKVLLIGLNSGIVSFMGYFLFGIDTLIILSVFLLGSSVIFFGFYSLFTIVRTKEKNSVVRTFMASFFFMIIGTVLGVLALLQNYGLIGVYRFGDIHILVMSFGVIFMLYSAVVFKIIPMFYVTKEFALWIKKSLHVSLILILLSFTISTLLELEILSRVLKTALALIGISFGIYTAQLLKERKRARSDLSVNFFYFASFNLIIGSLLWIFSIYFNLQIEFLLGTVFGMGFIYPLINGMLYKIIPFLTWFHLSSKSIFEAEMGQVMPASVMKTEFYLFVASYVSLIITLLWQPFVVFFALIFFISSFLLLFSIVSGYRYHADLIKKASDNGSN
jgi:hypothetical protein